MNINKEIIEQIKNSNNVAIFVHIRPDADCLGSASAFKEALNLLKINADIYCDEEEISSNFNFLTHFDTINVRKCSEYDLAVALDCSDRGRLGANYELFKSIKKTIKIDHHKTQDNFADINFVEIVSSTALILYYLIAQLTEFNNNIACGLYTGIAGDTGCFLHSNTTYLEHEVAAKLLKYDFDLEHVNYNLFKRRNAKQGAVLKLAHNSLRLLQNNQLAIIALTQKDYASVGATKKDAIGLSDIVVNLEGVLMGVVLGEERPGLFTCSLRSSGDIDVSVVAEAFGGGGHQRAAGCNIFGHLPTVIKKIEAEFIKHLKK